METTTWDTWEAGGSKGRSEGPIPGMHILDHHPILGEDSHDVKTFQCLRAPFDDIAKLGFTSLQFHDDL